MRRNLVHSSLHQDKIRQHGTPPQMNPPHRARARENDKLKARSETRTGAGRASPSQRRLRTTRKRETGATAVATRRGFPVPAFARRAGGRGIEMTGVVRFSSADRDPPPRRPTIGLRSEREDVSEGKGSDGGERGTKRGTRRRMSTASIIGCSTPCCKR